MELEAHSTDRRCWLISCKLVRDTRAALSGLLPGYRSVTGGAKGDDEGDERKRRSFHTEHE